MGGMIDEPLQWEVVDTPELRDKYSKNFSPSKKKAFEKR